MVDWIRFISGKLGYRKKTLHYAVAYMDTIFSLCRVKHKEFKLICFMCIYIAAKLEERDRNIPYISVVLNEFNHQYSKNKFEKCEKQIFKLLNYNLTFKISLTYLHLFLEQGLFTIEDLKALKVHDIPTFLGTIEELALEMLEASLDHYVFYSFTALAVASSVVICV